MKKAIVVGINNYPGAPLKGPERDAASVAELLRTSGNGAPNFDDVMLLTDVPTKGFLTQQLYQLFKREDDISLFYFSGHGSADEVDTYLTTPDYEPFNAGVSVNTLLSIANASKCRNKVIILDCCHAGSAGSSNLFGGTTSFINSGVTILAASRADEPALEIGGRGVFTDLLLEALRGGAADISGMISPGGIYAYIDKSLGAFDQRPVFKTNVNRFVSLRQVAPPVSPHVLRDIVHFFSDPRAEYALNPSYEETNTPAVEHTYIEPYADAANVAKFKMLQQYQSVGLVVPVDAPYMFFAAMNSTSCRLTPLGQHYWQLAKEGRIK